MSQPRPLAASAPTSTPIPTLCDRIRRLHTVLKWTRVRIAVRLRMSETVIDRICLNNRESRIPTHALDRLRQVEEAYADELRTNARAEG